MKKNKLKVALLTLTFSAGFLFLGCSSDDNSISGKPGEPDEQVVDLKINASYEIPRSRVQTIQPDLSQFTSPTLSWKVIKFNDTQKDSVVSSKEILDFISIKEGVYTLEIDVSDQKTTVKKEFDILVTKEQTEYAFYATKVFDFLPAYGQFVNKLPLFEEGDTRETMTQKVEDLICNPNGSLVSLGGFGGYVIVGFDHTIANIPGRRDFRVMGNAFKNSSEPGIIQVAYDKNKNGKPDEDEWFEIYGSEHSNPQTIPNYEITFYKPTAELDAATGNIDEYIRWKDNQGNEGWKPKNSFHSQSYYPLWVQETSLTFKGTLLPNNAIDSNGQGNNWQLKEFDWGYADNFPNSDDESAIDISWAVDKNGDKVHLPGVDFIKVYTGLNQEAGWLGETSTEVTGFFDLHIKGEHVESN